LSGRITSSIVPLHLASAPTTSVAPTESVTLRDGLEVLGRAPHPLIFKGGVFRPRFRKTCLFVQSYNRPKVFFDPDLFLYFPIFHPVLR